MQTTLQTSDYQQVLSVDVYPLEVDWPLLIDDITRHGVTPSRQADMLGKGWSTFQRWLHGTEPRFRHGHALLILHQKICGPELTLQRFSQMNLGE
jgi:hypothetical protein